MKRHGLTDLFDKEDDSTFTHYDYLLQVILNGQPTALKEHVKEIKTMSLLKFIDRTEMSEIYKDIIRQEIIDRTGKEEN